MALAVLAVVLMGCLAGIGAVVEQVRCTDAAREAARLAARGDDDGARAVIRDLAPAGASLELSRSADAVTASVSVPAVGGMLPGVHIRASGVAAREDTVPP